jgi:hypothetical protein
MNMKRLLAVFAACTLLAACAAPPPRAPVIDGAVRLLDRSLLATTDGMASAREWQVNRPTGTSPLALVDLEGTVAVRADAPAGTTMGRRLATTVGATPFFRWSWYLEPTAFGGGPGEGAERGMRVRVHFRSPSRPPLERYGRFVGMQPPEWDRYVEFGFSGFGTARADEARLWKWAADDKGRKLELREPRARQAGAWHVESIDLAEVHRHFWPGEDPAAIQITLVSLGGLPGSMPEGVPPTIGYLADIVLSR